MISNDCIVELVHEMVYEPQETCAARVDLQHLDVRIARLVGPSLCRLVPRLSHVVA